MKIIVVLFLLLNMFLRLSYGSKYLSKEERWKERYDLDTNTGVLAGKVTKNWLPRVITSA